MLTTEPIFDVLRGITTVASFSISIDQAKHVWAQIFTGTCDHCHGAGIVICPRCSGTKDRRSRPAGMNIQQIGFIDGRDFHHPCIHCGPNGVNDFMEDVSDDEDRAWAVRDDLQLSMVNRPRKSAISILAGTVACPECKGCPRFARHTPNFVSFFGLEAPWTKKVALRQPAYYIGKQNRPASRRRQLLEWPGRPPASLTPLEQALPPPREVFDDDDDGDNEPSEPGKGAGEVMTGFDQLKREDFIISYVDDNESEVDDDIELPSGDGTKARVRRARRARR